MSHSVSSTALVTVEFDGKSFVIKAPASVVRIAEGSLTIQLPSEGATMVQVGVEPRPREKGGDFMARVAKAAEGRQVSRAEQCYSIQAVADALGVRPMVVYAKAFREEDPLPIRYVAPQVSARGRQKYGVLKAEADAWIKRQKAAGGGGKKR